ncbi:MAG: hypothetical protein N2557_04600 [Hydrogenophilus sp.]|nr:hypothetical protein [Hydrogenophilus sp.]
MTSSPDFPSLPPPESAAGNLLELLRQFLPRCEDPFDGSYYRDLCARILHLARRIERIDRDGMRILRERLKRLAHISRRLRVIEAQLAQLQRQNALRPDPERAPDVPPTPSTSPLFTPSPPRR